MKRAPPPCQSPDPGPGEEPSGLARPTADGRPHLADQELPPGPPTHSSVRGQVRVGPHRASSRAGTISRCLPRNRRQPRNRNSQHASPRPRRLPRNRRRRTLPGGARSGYRHHGPSRLRRRDPAPAPAQRDDPRRRVRRRHLPAAITGTHARHSGQGLGGRSVIRLDHATIAHQPSHETAKRSLVSVTARRSLDCTGLHCPAWFPARGRVLTFHLTSCQKRETRLRRRAWSG